MNLEPRGGRCHNCVPNEPELTVIINTIKTFGPNRFSRFDVYWIQTDRETDKQVSV